MAHGLGAIKEVGLHRYAVPIAAAGHRVLAFDYLTFGQSEGKPRQIVDIAAQQDDWRAAVEFARSLSAVRPDGIVLWGTSYGGGHVLALAGELPGIAGAIAQVPMADGLAAARIVGAAQTLRLLAHGLIDAVGGKLGKTPHRIAITGHPGDLAVLTTPEAHAGLSILNPDGYPWPNEIAARFVLHAGTYRPIRAAGRITCPLLVILSEDDTITPQTAAATAAARAPRGELIRLPGGHYSAYHGAGFQRSLRAQLDLLERIASIGDQLPSARDGTPA